MAQKLSTFSNSVNLQIFQKKNTLFLGEARDIFLRQGRLVQFYQDFAAKAQVFVNPTELEIFWQAFEAKALLLVIPKALEIF